MMPLNVRAMIITNGKEERIHDNDFLLIEEGYHLYPLHTPLIVKKTLNSLAIGEGEISKLELYGGKTKIIYKLTSLKNTN